MISVNIVGVSQSMSFSDGSYSNVLVIRLPDGKDIQVTVSEDVVRQVTAIFVARGGPAVERAVKTSSSAPAPLANQGAQEPYEVPITGGFSGLSVDDPNQPDEFGGEFDGPSAPETTEWAAPEPPPAPITRSPANLRVTADAGGNPVVQGRNVRDASELSGGRAADLEDDGVGSI